MTEIIAATIAPAAVILAVAYPLRPQCGRHRAHAVPARDILARLAADPHRSGAFGDTTRPPAFTVQPRRILWIAQ